MERAQACLTKRAKESKLLSLPPMRLVRWWESIWRISGPPLFTWNRGGDQTVSEPTIHRTQTILRGSTDQALSPLSLIHISEPTRRTPISYAVFCLKKKKKKKKKNIQ